MYCFRTLLVLVIFSTSMLQITFCKRYDWKLNFSSSPITHTVTPINGAMAYTVVSNGSTEIVSEYGTFALAFLEEELVEDFTSVPYFVPRMLAVVMQKRINSTSIAAVAVWQIDLMDSILTASIDNIQLDETGNLAWYHETKLVWQSFDYPLDILLPGQQLRYGMRLNAKNEEGDSFTAQVARNGFIFYYTPYMNNYYDKYFFTSDEDFNSSSRIPYGVWSLRSTTEFNTVESVVQQPCDGYEAVIEYTGNELKLFYDKNIKSDTNISCELPGVTLPMPVNPQFMHLPYIQLVSSGDLVIFTYNSNSAGWVVASRLFGNNLCSLPTSCRSYDQIMLYDSSSYKCIAITESQIEKHSDFSSVHGVSHFSAKFRKPIYNVSIVECKNTMNYTGYTRHPFLIYDNVRRDCFQLYGWVSPLIRDESSTSLYRDNTTTNMTALFDLSWVISFYQTPDMVVPTFPFWFGGSIAVLWLTVITALVIVKSKVPAMVKQRLIHGYYYSTKYTKVGATIIRHSIINTMDKFNKSVQETESLLSKMQGLPRRYSYLEIENATKGFTTILGAGGFGAVYEGTTQDGKHVAVKKLASIGKQVTKQFVTEIVGIGGISHLNIVKLFGFCIEGNAKRMLVYEFMPNGSLDRWIFGSQDNKSLGWHQRLDIALGTAKGLKYLHEECTEPILHLDVKPQNILLDANFVPKVADFGVAKLLEHRDMTHATTTVRGTFTYMAPEWMMQSVATKKCDVYSYGLVLLEIIGGRRNTDWSRVEDLDDDDDYSWYFPSLVVRKVKEGKVVEVWDEKIRSFAAENEIQARTTVHLALWCIQSNPSLRPSFSEVVEILEGQRLVGEPPLAFHFSFQISKPEQGDLKSSTSFQLEREV